MSGRDMTRSVSETICMSFEPVVVEMLRGLIRTSYRIARWSHGIRKCVPSPDAYCQLILAL